MAVRQSAHAPVKGRNRLNPQSDRADRAEIASAEWMLLVQDDAEEAAVNGQTSAFAVSYEAQFPEFIHEVTYARPGGANHLRQVILTDPGK